MDHHPHGQPMAIRPSSSPRTVFKPFDFPNFVGFGAAWSLDLHCVPSIGNADAFDASRFRRSLILGGVEPSVCRHQTRRASELRLVGFVAGINRSESLGH